MKTLIVGSGPIGRWLALRLQKADTDVTLLARTGTRRHLEQNGIEIVDGLTGERQHARVGLVERLDAEDRYDLVVVAMQKASRVAACPMLAEDPHLKNILFLGNDVSGFHRYFDHLPREVVLLGFPGAGGGWVGEDLVVMDREKPRSHHGELFLGELDGTTGERPRQIKKLFEAADIRVSLENDIDGWLKYHYAFIAPTAGAIFKKRGDLQAVAGDRELLHQYCRACREAGNVLRKVGYHKRQPGVFNLYYWLPRFLEPFIFGKMFGSRSAEVRFGLHAPTVGPELLEMADEFEELKTKAEMETPDLDALLSHVPRPGAPLR
jgi:2-dehydropantoate 2-reductase